MARELEILRRDICDHSLMMRSQWDQIRLKTDNNAIDLSVFISEIEKMVQTWEFKAQHLSRNIFENLPPELLTLIFSKMDFPELMILSIVCKTFQAHLENDLVLWKDLSLKLWINDQFDLTEIMDGIGKIHPSKNWKWCCTALYRKDKMDGPANVSVFGSRISIQRNDGEITKLKSFNVGDMFHSRLEGIGFQVQYTTNTIRYGYFEQGRHKSGIKIIPGKLLYKGNFGEFGEYEGFGQLHRMDVGWKYEGQFRVGIFDGMGKMTWANGFEYYGLWERNEPGDQNDCIHPDLKKAMKKILCTGSVTGNKKTYGQFMSACEDCDGNSFCSVCTGICHASDHKIRKPVFHRLAVCYCVQRGYCYALPAHSE
eukprot:TRINITY_DN9858_c0_g1_i1.p1 TRINITY_DN9858_c0_g1~~TRINITY_DN9858_c0_g1_i1.p1  ORF type:complete len:369 (-),score=72.24 TRINITY_DN9858_c0_g1_i1:16-1122(-)